MTKREQKQKLVAMADTLRVDFLGVAVTAMYDVLMAVEANGDTRTYRMTYSEATTLICELGEALYGREQASKSGATEPGPANSNGNPDGGTKN